MMLLVALVVCILAFIAVTWWEISKPLKGANTPNVGATNALHDAFDQDDDLEIFEINPATGLYMINGVDAAGNPCGYDEKI